MFSLSGKNVLVTGGCSGIGLAVVKRFLAAGARVIAADLRTTKEFNLTDAEFVEINVADEARVRDAFSEAEAKLGKLDIIVNNAGIGLEEGTIEKTDIAVFKKTLDVNVTGVLFGLKYGPRHMNDGGSIVNTASGAAFLTSPQSTAYGISKAAVVKLTRQAAVELGERKIRVNAVCPGTTTTPMEPADSPESTICGYATIAGRPAAPEEQAAVFHFLASDDSSYVNAQAIAVDGGWVNGLTYAEIEKLLS